MRIRLGLAATLAFVVLTLGPTVTSATPAVAPSDNAVVHWSGGAPTARGPGPGPGLRPPASSSVLGRKARAAVHDTVASNDPIHARVGSSAFTQFAD